MLCSDRDAPDVYHLRTKNQRANEVLQEAYIYALNLKESPI